LSGGAKALWVVGLILFPLIGSLVYLIVRGAGMAQREAAREHRSRQQFESYVRDVAGSSGPAPGTPVDDLTRLAELRSNGIITEADFDVMKARLRGAASGGGSGTSAPGRAAAERPRPAFRLLRRTRRAGERWGSRRHCRGRYARQPLGGSVVPTYSRVE